MSKLTVSSVSGPRKEVGKKNELDLDKLAKAVGNHESHNCKDRNNFTKVNNCHGIKIGGKVTAFKTQTESYEMFKKIWAKPTGYYKGQFPNLALARLYSGNDAAGNWLKNVTSYYYSH